MFDFKVVELVSKLVIGSKYKIFSIEENWDGSENLMLVTEIRKFDGIVERDGIKYNKFGNSFYGIGGNWTFYSKV